MMLTLHNPAVFLTMLDTVTTVVHKGNSVMCFLKYCAMKFCGEMEALLHAFLNSPLVGSELLASRLEHFMRGEMLPGTQW